MKANTPIPFLLTCLFIALGGCSGVPEQSRIDTEIDGLVTLEAKAEYLEAIFADDQKVRGIHGPKILLLRGEGSVEDQNHGKAQIAQDGENLVKIEKYLLKYGHPKKDEVGEIAAMTPWTVLHHAQEYDVRANYFATLYNAYRAGDIDAGSMSMLLGRMYEMKRGDRFEIPGSYRTEDKINALISELELTKE